MVRNLFLIRHAKAAEPSASQKDINRDLAPKGYQDAPRAGRYMFEQQWHPDIILSSSAQRAMATAELLAEQLRFDTNRIKYLEELYQASVRSMLQLLSEQKDTQQQIIIVGHNPVLSYLAEYLTGQEIGSIVPCGIVNIRLETDTWAEISKDTAELDSYTIPENMIL